MLEPAGMELSRIAGKSPPPDGPLLKNSRSMVA